MGFFLQSICQHEAVFSANDFFHVEKFSQVPPRCSRLALEAVNFLSGENPLFLDIHASSGNHSSF